MFLSYYGLENNLFNKKIKSKEAYKSSDYTNIQNRLKYLKDVKGIGIIVGSAGTGKTYSLRCFKEQMNPDLYKIIYISATRLTVFEFLNAICKELGLDVGSCYRNDIENKIQVAIKKLKKEEKKEIIIIIDNAENLNSEILKELKILYDFDMDSVDYISIVISGNEDILTELRKIKYETLKQRIIVKYEIQGLNRAETKDYINTRLKLSGQLNEIFQENAINAIYGITNGNIRKINTMVQKSLMIGYQKGLKKIDEEIVRLAKEEIDI